MQLLCFLLLVASYICNVAVGRPQLIVLEKANVNEVSDPEAKRELFNSFNNGRSILYQSLFPEEGQIIGEIVIEVESQPLVLTRPKDPEAKRRRLQAEKRIQEDDS